ncbi:uncharacterized protein TEOVI_000765700 [Trypanosoma equiperdum]|uniref:Uncharacterized protein n=2 Tax=Trypanozoon TaxID=39700 RepID=Q38EP4_TRYB2|nr:hypothetical protein, conserved [Trypanosoma brucei brucei TREU927]EAN76726.1 hypothetical protein, conserved [Trypanosoma brucei brucei TREU927]SCU64954.1 hypothetical protein, conserved [Trypanosoma equiperdum]
MNSPHDSGRSSATSTAHSVGSLGDSGGAQKDHSNPLPEKEDEEGVAWDERLRYFVGVVKSAFDAMRSEQRLCNGSVCSKRLQDRIEWDYPAEYATFVNGLFNRSWDRFLEAKTDIVCYPHNEGGAESNTKWLMAHGSLRCRLRTEDINRVRDADEMLGRMVRDKCLWDLEDACRSILMEVFLSMDASAIVCKGCMRLNKSEQYHLGSLAVWEPILARLWGRQTVGGAVRLRDMERPSQQLGFHVRLRCRWTELLGNNLLAKCICGSVLRVFLNVEKPEMLPVAGAGARPAKEELAVKLHQPSGELIVALGDTGLWGRRPPSSQPNPPFLACCRGYPRHTR